jgi:hypothetical protein
MADVYDKHLNLKMAAKELGMKWQTLYWNLQQIGHPVTGDKTRYGSPTDKFAREVEQKFNLSIPYAEDLNSNKFQTKIDFKIKGLYVDVKASTKKDGYKNTPNRNPSFRWAFCCKVQ